MLSTRGIYLNGGSRLALAHLKLPHQLFKPIGRVAHREPPSPCQKILHPCAPIAPRVSHLRRGRDHLDKSALEIVDKTIDQAPLSPASSMAGYFESRHWCGLPPPSATTRITSVIPQMDTSSSDTFEGFLDRRITIKIENIAVSKLLFFVVVTAKKTAFLMQCYLFYARTLLRPASFARYRAESARLSHASIFESLSARLATPMEVVT